MLYQNLLLIFHRSYKPAYANLKVFYLRGDIMEQKKIRVLIAKPGLDGHDRGAKIIVMGLRDAGMEVIYTGIRKTPDEIARIAVDEDVDVLGLSCLSGAHNELFPKVVEKIRKNTDKKILIFGGGTIPDRDIPFLKDNGIEYIFGPGTPIKTVVDTINRAIYRVL